MRSLATLALFAVTCGFAADASAAEPDAYGVAARLDVEQGTVQGAQRIAVRVRAGERRVRLWVYTDRLAVSPAALDERNARWIYPGERNYGTTTIADVTVDGRPAPCTWERRNKGERGGRDFAGSDLVIDVGTGAARSVEIALRFSLKMPERFGRLGRVDGQMSLAAPWYPLVVNREGAFQHHVPHRVRVELRGNGRIVADGTVLGRSGEVKKTTDYVPVFVSREIHVKTHLAGEGMVRFISATPSYEAPSKSAPGADGLTDVDRIQTSALIARAAASVFRTMKAAGLSELSPELTVLVVPSRVELAATAGSLVIVSDRLFEVFPIAQVREFHQRVLRHAMFKALIHRRNVHLERAEDAPLAEELRADVLSDLHDALRHGRARSPRDLIGFAAFHPAVDQLLYAPQIEFADVFFASPDAPDPFRDDPDFARTGRSHSRRVLQNLELLLTPERYRAFARDLLTFRAPVRRALTALGDDIATRLDAWLDRAPGPVNYALGAIRSRRLASGDYEHRIEIRRDGDSRDDPVEVQVEDDDGHVVHGVWPGVGKKGYVILHTHAPLSKAELDPAGRLYQSPELVSGHPRTDDSTSHPFRPPLLQAFALNASLADRLVSGYVEFMVRKRYDLEHGIVARIEHTLPATGGSLRYVHGAGPKVHNNRRIGHVSAGVEFERLHADFTGVGIGGWGAGALLSGGVDTRSFLQDPRTGYGLAGSVRVGGVARDNGQFRANVSSNVRGNVTLPIGLRQAFVFAYGGGVTLGPSLPAERQVLGGRYLLRGYGVSELVGKGRAFVVAEHRWTALSDLSWNLLHLAWLREVQVATFAGGGLLFDSTRGRDVTTAAEVGAGLRLHFDYGGVQPGVLALDVALPLVRTATQPGDPARSPVGVFLSFDQFY